MVTFRRPKRLSAAFVKAVNRPGRYGDGRGGHGLSLLVKPASSGGFSKSWAQRLRINGRLVSLGLGSYPVITLKKARAKALDNARAAADGVDPRAKPLEIPTFSHAAQVVIDIHKSTWKNSGRTAQIWQSSLDIHAMPSLGAKRVSDIVAADVLGVLTRIWQEKPETARRIKHRISAIMSWSVAQGFRDDNPAGEAINAALPRSVGVRRHQKALHHSEVKTAIERVRKSGAWLASKLCFEFMTLTATRPGESREARWVEVDLEAQVWVIPAERMKHPREHRVPLSVMAIDLLRQAQGLAPDSDLVFPSVTGKTMSDSTISKLIRELNIDAVPHGFRSSFRDWCADTGQPREIAEAALAHTVRGVEGAYFRSDLFERRRRLMDDWAKYLN